MKTKTMLYCGSFVFALLICSCSKSKNDDPVFSGPLIKTIMIRFSDSNFYDHTLYYDANSRIAEMNLTHTLGTTLAHVKTIYKYGTDSVTAMYYDTDAQVLLKSEIYLLNASGQAVQKHSGPDGYNLSDTYYTYDGSGFLIRDSTEYAATIVLRIVKNYTISDGNIARVVTRTEATSGTSTQETIYAYVPGKDNSIGNLNQGVTFLGKQNANPVASATYTPEPLVGPNPLLYTYDYDAQGRIITATTNNPVVTTYTYY
jgi:hypothetical protein